MIWLDNKDKRDEAEVTGLELEYTENGNRHRESTRGEILERITREAARDAEQYIL
jgi:hypothetical protein